MSGFKTENPNKINQINKTKYKLNMQKTEGKVTRPETSEEESLHLVDKDSNQSLPLKLVSFDINIV